ncbi:unnamed protein product [Polarella glacialis]|uniref:Uncharacterized protein n=1 Tax=Polarella glacialis TaxID=89957 RepID=A0A813EM22_POLGL|nr:unnamed protein product [Polarella glacialis]
MQISCSAFALRSNRFNRIFFLCSLLRKTEEGGFEVGAKGRVCKMLESEVEPSSSGECEGLLGAGRSNRFLQRIGFFHFAVCGELLCAAAHAFAVSLPAGLARIAGLYSEAMLQSGIDFVSPESLLVAISSFGAFHLCLAQLDLFCLAALQVSPDTSQSIPPPTLCFQIAFQWGILEGYLKSVFREEGGGHVTQRVSTSGFRGGNPVTIEGEAPCRVTELAAPLFRGTLEELDEDDLGLASSHETESTVTAASEMVDLLGELGRHLQAIRQRWMLTVLMGMTDPGQEGSAGSPWQGLLDSDRQGLESMLGMMSSYRQIIGQMDRLLSDASQSAEEVIDAVEDEDEEEGRLLRDLHRRGRPHGDSGTESAYTSSRRLPASIRDVEHLSESREMTMSDFTAGRPLRSRPSPISDSSSGQTSSVQAESRLSRLPPQPEVTERRAGTPVSPETDRPRPRPRPVLGGRLSRLQATGGLGLGRRWL